MLDSAIWQNEKFASLPAMGRLLSVGMINNADDQGRGKAHPAHLRSMIFPYDDISLSDVSEWLALIAQNETVLVYTVGGKDYYQVVNWWAYQSHQYAMPSQHPKPPGWSDRIRKTFTKGVIVTCNWITADGKRSPDTCNEQGLAIQVNNQVNDQVNDQVNNDLNVQGEDTSISISSSISSSSSSSLDNDFRGKLIQQWEAVIGMFPTASYPDAIIYMDKLQDRGALDWWGLAITETVDKAKRPSWQYMKAILEGWLAAGAPSTYTNGKTEKAATKTPKVTHIINPITGLTEAVAS